jgi:hypothetical protein
MKMSESEMIWRVRPEEVRPGQPIGTSQAREPSDSSPAHPTAPLKASSRRAFRRQWAPNVRARGTHVLVPDVLEQLELAVCPLAQHRRRKGLHDLLDGDRRVGELVLGGAVWRKGPVGGSKDKMKQHE